VSTTLEAAQGSITVFPTLARVRGAIEVRFDWTAAEAASGFEQGAVHLVRAVLDRQMRDLAKRASADMRLMLAATPYFSRDELIDLLLQLSCRRACFGDAEPPRSREAFEAAVDRGRADLAERLEGAMTEVGAWMGEARNVRRLLEDPRARAYGAAAEETQAHLTRLLSAQRLPGLSEDWLRQISRYLKAEERRWQRTLARGGESAQILADLGQWTSRIAALEERAAAELRRPAGLEEIGLWLEEYRVSLYAQELKTRGPVSAARLAQREAGLAAWFAR
jgi:ATP-dependent helicase HrpA